MATIATLGYNFPGVRQKLSRIASADAAEQAGIQANNLSRLHERLLQAKADGSAALLERIDANVDVASLDTLRRMANREQVVDELYDVGEKKSRSLGRWRNFFALLPLLWTWLALSWAAFAYENELQHNDALYIRPFLELWQQNFGGRIPFSFAIAAAFDVGFIGIIVYFTLVANRAEHREEQNTRELIAQFDDTVGKLFATLERNIDQLLPDNANPARWAEETQKIINKTQETIRDAMLGAKTLAEENQKIVESAKLTIQTMADSLTETLKILEGGNQAFISGAIRTVKDVVTDANTATATLVETGVKPIVTNLRDQVQLHRDAVQGLGHNVDRLGTASETLAEKARDHTQLTEAIDTRLDSMNTRLAEYRDGIVGVTDQMHEAAEGVRYVLGGTSRENIELMAARVLEASNVLSNATSQLAQTTNYLLRVASGLPNIGYRPPTRTQPPVQPPGQPPEDPQWEYYWEYYGPFGLRKRLMRRPRQVQYAPQAGYPSYGPTPGGAPGAPGYGPVPQPGAPGGTPGTPPGGAPGGGAPGSGPGAAS